MIDHNVLKCWFIWLTKKNTHIFFYICWTRLQNVDFCVCHEMPLLTGVTLCPPATNHVIIFYHLLSSTLKTKSTACILSSYLFVACGHSLRLLKQILQLVGISLYCTHTVIHFCLWACNHFLGTQLHKFQIFAIFFGCSLSQNTAKMNGFYAFIM